MRDLDKNRLKLLFQVPVQLLFLPPYPLVHSNLLVQVPHLLSDLCLFPEIGSAQNLAGDPVLP